MWESREYNDSYFKEIIEMSVENYGAENDICDEKFLIHQYFDNPAGKALIELAVDPENGTLAGQYVVQPADIRCFGEDKKCVISLNTLTREAYRGQGIFVGLAEKTYQRASEEGYAFVYGAPNQNSYPGFMNKLSFEDIHQFPLYARPLNLSKMVEERGYGRLFQCAAKPVQLIFRNKGKKDSSIVELTEKNVYVMNRFWERIKDKYPIMGIRDAKYIRYRYLNVPRRKYYPYIAVRRGRVVAFAVGRIREVAGFQCGMIADFLYVRGCEAEAKKLIKYLTWKMKAEGASLAGCIILRHTSEAGLLRKCGYYHVPERLLPQPTPLILRLFNKKLSHNKYTDINNWFFTTGDYDVV